MIKVIKAESVVSENAGHHRTNIYLQHRSIPYEISDGPNFSKGDGSVGDIFRLINVPHEATIGNVCHYTSVLV